MKCDKVFKRIEKNTFASCIPIISRNQNELLADVEAGVANGCDFLEWRRDHFMPDEVVESDDEINLLNAIKARMPNQGLIYTYRSHREGGVCLTSDEIREAAITTAIKSKVVDYVDVELNNEATFLERIKQVLKDSCTQWIVSHHNFEKTPNSKEMTALYTAMDSIGGDVLKLAVTPHTTADLRCVLRETLNYNDQSEKTIIAIAMGELGGITRIVTELCGGSLTYTAGTGKTAPGQLSLEEIVDLRKKIALI